MSNAVLQFSLGLATGNFLPALNKASSGVKSFVGGLVGLGAISAGVMKAISKGAELERLHRRTGESAGDLFALQKGFKAAGLSADDVGPALFMMDKALGGVNEMGEKTEDIFGRMGLKIGDLKKMGGAQSLQAIMAALNKLGQTDAAKGASSIFGRMQAGNMIQLARSTDDFTHAMKSAAEQAAIFQRNSNSFFHLELSLDKLKGKMNTLFAGIAEGAAPGIQKVADMLDSVSLTGFGVGIGRGITAITEAFSEGSLIELIALTISTGFEIGLAAVPALLENLGYTLLKVIETPLAYLQAGLTYAEEKTMEWMYAFMGMLPKGVQKALGVDPENLAALKDFKADSFSDIMKDRKDDGVKFFSDDNGFDNVKSDSSARLKEALASIKKISEPLAAMVNGLVSRAPKPDASKVIPRGGNTLASESYTYKPEFTAFEKMGFVMGGSSNPATEHARRTADATQKTATLMETVVQLLSTGEPAGANAI